MTAMDDTWCYETEPITRTSSLDVELDYTKENALEEEANENVSVLDIIQVEIGDEDFILAVPEYCALDSHATEPHEEVHLDAGNPSGPAQAQLPEQRPAYLVSSFFLLPTAQFQAFRLDQRGKFASWL